MTTFNPASHRLAFLQTTNGRNVMSKLQELRNLLDTFEKDFVKFYDKGNKSAGTRVRKHMNDLKRKAQEIRKEVQEIKAQAKAEEPTPVV
jgi:cytochrome c556